MLDWLRSARGARVIVVDGGSTDATAVLSIAHADRVLQSERGRAQHECGRAAIDDGADVLLFVHADSELPESADRLIETSLRATWGRFDVRIDGQAPMLSVVSAMMNWRSRLTGICTGDQGIFVTRSAFERLAGFAPIALMEDVESRNGPRVFLGRLRSAHAL